MEQSTDGDIDEDINSMFAIKCKLKTIAKNKKIMDILDEYVIDCAPRGFKMWMLFKLYAFESFANNTRIDISKDTLTRCVNLITSGSKSLHESKHKKYESAKTKARIDQKNKTISALKATLLKYKKIFDYDAIDTPYDSDVNQGINRPLDYTCQMMFTNTMNHIVGNFYKNQRMYVRQFLLNALVNKEIKLNDNQIGYIAYKLHTLVHDPTSLDKEKDKLSHRSFNHVTNKDHDKELKKLLVKLTKVLPVIATEIREIVPVVLRGKLVVTNLKKNLGVAIGYFFKMAKYLDTYSVKSFSPLPNMKIQKHHITLDIQFLFAVYNKWSPIRVGTITEFRESSEKYLGKMFEVKKVLPKLMAKHKQEIYSTDGYSVSMIFKSKNHVHKYTKGKKQAKSKKALAYENKEKADKKKTLLKSQGVIDGIVITRDLEPGLYAAEDIRMEEDDIDEYQIVSVDPGNTKMLNFKRSDNSTFTIKKGYYNRYSHITRNTHKRHLMTSANKRIMSINEEMSRHSLKSASLGAYLSYLKIVVRNWKYLWNYHLNPKFCAIKYDTFIHSKMAVGRICRDIRKRMPVKGDYRPEIIAFGSGNGNMTIDNTKNSSAHGPIKRIAKALSQTCRVVITDEYNSSRLCSGCHVELVHPVTHHTEPLRLVYERLEKKRVPYNLRNIKGGLKKYLKLKHPDYKQKVNREKESYGLCCCKSKDHNCDNRLRNRDNNAETNIRNIMKATVRGKPIPAFARPKILKGK